MKARTLITLRTGLGVLMLLGMALSVASASQAGEIVLLPTPPQPLTRENLDERLAEKSLRSGLPVFIRIFKQESELEVWLQKNGRWKLFGLFPVCTWSGELGPKLQEGDLQSPEGFYKVTRRALNPNSRFHLSFNLGFPNAYDRAHERTGSYLMVHGSCVSIGCYAMTNPGIEVIYQLVKDALWKGQRVVNVHIFPFRLTHEALEEQTSSQWYNFWRNLKEGHDAFEEQRTVPHVTVRDKRYVIGKAG